MNRSLGKTAPSKVQMAVSQRAATPGKNVVSQIYDPGEISTEAPDSGSYEPDEDLLSVALNPCEAVPDLYVEQTDAGSVHVCWSFRRGHLEPPAAGWEVELWAYDFGNLNFDDEGLFSTIPPLQRLGAAILGMDSRDTSLEDLRANRRYKVRVRALLPMGLGPTVGPWSELIKADTRGYSGPGPLSKGSQRFWHNWANSRRPPSDP